MIRRIILMCLPLFLFYPLAAAQTGGGKSRVKTGQRAKGTTAPDMDHFERLLSLYVQAKAERADFYSSMTSLLVFYGGQDDAGKAKCRRCLAQHMDEYYNDRDKPVEALAIADLYESLAAFDDPERLKISYYRGEYAATVEGDSIALHRAISDIEAFPAGPGTDREAHLLVLRDYLEQIRNYVPVDRTIDGIWISDLRTKHFGGPKMILKVIAGKGGSPIFRMYHLPENYAPFFQIGTLISAMSMPERIKPESARSGTMGLCLYWEETEEPLLDMALTDSGALFCTASTLYLFTGTEVMRLADNAFARLFYDSGRTYIVLQSGEICYTDLFSGISE